MQNWINQHLLLFVLLVLAGAVGFRWVLLNAIAAASGWKNLARRFPAQFGFSGVESKWQSARLRFLIGYNNCLVVGAGPTGLSIRTIWGIRTGHPPLMIPWNEVSVGETRVIMKISFVTLLLGQPEPIPFMIRQSLAARLQAAAGAAWPAPINKIG